MNIETANRLLQYRKENNLSQEELAEKIGVSRQAVSKWERAEASPDTDNLIRLAEIYGVSLDEMLTGKKAEATEEAPESDSSDPEQEYAEPDENTTYKRYDKVSFKHGIHVDSKDGDSVHISFKDGVRLFRASMRSVCCLRQRIRSFRASYISAGAPSVLPRRPPLQRLSLFSPGSGSRSGLCH